MNKIGFDFNNLAMRCFHGIPEVEAESPSPNFQIWDFSVFNSILAMMNKLNPSEVILCVDGGNSWRKIVYPIYKENRKKKREESPVNWDLFYQNFNRLLDELRETFPIKIVNVKRSEADDSLAVLSKMIKDFVIVSADSDFEQLSDFCKIYHPLRREYVKNNDPEGFLLRLCLQGQNKDNIFNVKTPFNWPNEKRKPPLGIKGAEKIIEQGIEKFLSKKIYHDLKEFDLGIIEVNPEERFKQNKKVLDLRDSIPNIIQEKIKQEYYSNIIRDEEKIYKYFKEKNWPTILENYDFIEQKFQALF